MKQSNVSLIKSTFLFQGMDDDAVTGYLENCEVRQYSAGDVIHSAKHPAVGIGVIMSGRARIVSGNGDTLMRLLNRGEIFGAASVFAMSDSNKTAVVATVKCSVLVIPESVVRTIISEDSDAALRYISFLSDRVNFLNARISSLTAGDAVAKVAGFILSLETDAKGCCTVGDSFINIASRLNMGRASLYRTIDRFVSDGLILRNKENIRIMNRGGLEDILNNRSR